MAPTYSPFDRLRSLATGRSLRVWFQARREARKEFLWQRDQQREVFRHIILATRKIQDVQRAFAEDVAEVRGLRAHVEHAQPEMERLGEALATSRGVFEELEGRLSEALGSLGGRLDTAAELAGRVEALKPELDRLGEACTDTRSASEELGARLGSQLEELTAAVTDLRDAGEREDTGEAPELRARIGALQERLDLRGEELRLVRAELAALRMREGATGYDAGADDERVQLVNEQLEAERKRREELERLLAETQTRVEELECERRSAFLREETDRETRHELERAATDLERQLDSMRELVDGVVSEPAAAEAAELRERLRASEIERLDLEARHERELSEFADHSRARVDELNARIAELEARLATAELESAHAALPDLPADAQETAPPLADLMGEGQAEPTPELRPKGVEEHRA